MKSLRRPFAYSLADSYVGIATQAVATVILARLLSPAEIGVFSTAAVFAALASKFRDFGVSEYLIQARDVSPERLDAAFTVSLLVSWAASAALFTFSPLAAAFFAAAGVGEVMRLQAINFLMIPFGAIALASHHRNLNFRPLFLAGAISGVVGAAVSIGCAASGQGYISLAYGSVAGVATSVAVAVATRPAGVRPRFTLHGLKEVLRFGRHLSAILVFGQIGKSAPEVVLAKVIDFAAVGFFSRAAGLVELFNQAVMRAVSLLSLPYFSRDARASGQPPVSAFLAAQSTLTAIGWPFFACLALLAEPVVAIVYGEQWRSAVGLVRILCLAAMFELACAMYKDMLIGSGLPGKASRTEAVIQGTRILGLILVLPLGAAGACWGLLLASLFNVVLVYRQLLALSQIGWAEVSSALLPSARMTVLTLVPALGWLCARWIVGEPLLAAALLCGLATPIIWLVALRQTGHPLYASLAGTWTSARTGRWR